ncbi:MAG: iron donor protein CyaY [Alphaproteobacteria bacterium]|jgi:frataxin-like iron-binding protein CyaY|nr:iron donor protein CyaY [Alphaproteobacteria bacterium]
MPIEKAARHILSAVADAADALGLEIGGNDLMLTIDSKAGQYVLNWHAPTEQLWLSSPTSGAAHYALDGAEWKNTRGGEPLEARLAHELGLAFE